MRTITRRIVLAFMCLVCFTCASSLPGHGAYPQIGHAAAVKEPEVLVGLTRTTGIGIRVSDGYTLRTMEGAALDLPKHSEVRVELAYGKLTCIVTANGAPLYEGEISNSVYILASSEEGFFTVVTDNNPGAQLIGRSYRGDAVAIKDSKDIVVANLVSLEKYLWSVVSCEIPNSWDAETLKVQAVASRTYALKQMGASAAGVIGFDRSLLESSLRPEQVKIWAGSTDQVYKGRTFEDPRVVTACVETEGEVLTYLGDLIQAHFHADAAGMTEDPRFVWGGSIPYYAAVAEIEHSSPHSSWELSYDAQTLAQRLNCKGFTGSDSMVLGLEPGLSGRWSMFNVKSADEDLKLKPTEFRSALQLKSTWFSVFRQGGGLMTLGCLNPTLDVYVSNGSTIHRTSLSDCKVIGGDACSVSGLERGALAMSVSKDGPITFTFQGKGSGHGVGLSQWGANEMAKSGFGYCDILIHYYPGTSIERWW